MSSTERNWSWYSVAVAVAVGLGLAACQQAATPTPTLSRKFATDLAMSMQVDEALASSLRSLGDPLGGLKVGAVQDSQGMDIELDIEECAPMLDAGADSDADGYPAERTTYALDCELLALHLGGTLVLADKDDMDQDSGFYSDLALEISLNSMDENVRFGAVEYTLDVDAKASGTGYTVSQSGVLSQENVIVDKKDEQSFLEGEARLTYDATIAGSLRSGKLTIAAGDGTYSLATVPIDCSMLDGEEARKCQEQTSENPGTLRQLTMTATELAFDKENCDTAITGGSFAVQDNLGNTLTTSYDGCGKRSATYNGEPIG
jgi:hypothetical protein